MLSFDLSRLVPAGLSVDGVEDVEAGVIISSHPDAVRGRCPDCGTWSSRVHSGYVRKLNDLPIGGRRVQLIVRARRFFCDASPCHRRTFAERLDGVGAAKAAEQAGSMKSCSSSLSRSAVGPPPLWRSGSRSRSAMTPCCAPSVAAVRPRQRRHRSLASTIGPGDAISATARSSATSNADERSRCCPIESPRRSSSGCGNGPISRSSRVIAAARMPWPGGERCPTPLKSPIAGFSCKTPARPFSTRSANPCARSGPPSAPQPSIPRC